MIMVRCPQGLPRALSRRCAGDRLLPPDREAYAVEIDSELERVYGSKTKLTEDWSWIYEPLVLEVMFDEYGYDAVPEPEGF